MCDPMKVFISHAEGDGKLAAEIAQQLEAHGFSTFTPSDDLSVGENFALKIGEALEKSNALVVLISPASMESKWVRREIDYALMSSRFKGRLIPVQIKRTKDYPWIFKKFRFIDATGGTRGTGKRIARALETSAGAGKR